ncbi:MAG: sulfotransferase family protein, partial [Thermoplasmata archaeon]
MSSDPKVEAVAAPVAPKRVKLIYILGEYRSGSTILSVLLSADPTVRSTGELRTLPERFWTAARPCSCHAMPRDCPFWSKVYALCEGNVDLRALAMGKQRYETYGALPRLLLARLARSKRLDDHARRFAGFIHAIADAEGQSVVVDTSKDPVRGFVYSRCAPYGLDVYYVHTVRDGRAVAHSRVTRPGGGTFANEELTRSTWNFAARWSIVNFLAFVLCSRPRDRYTVVRYEDLVSDPVGVLRRLGRFLGLDPEGLSGPIEREEALPVPHLIAANRF